MLCLILGGTAHDRKKAIQEFVAKKYPRTTLLFSLYEQVPEEGALLAHAYHAQGFFSEQPVVVVKDSTLDFVETFSSTLPVLASSSTPFIFSDTEITAPTKNLFEKEKATIILLEKKEKASSFSKTDFFAIADAFSSRNRFSVWKELWRAYERGDAPEALVGIIFSRVRTMLRDKRYGKYSREELENLSSSLAFLLPYARERGEDSTLSLERWVLALPE